MWRPAFGQSGACSRYGAMRSILNLSLQSHVERKSCQDSFSIACAQPHTSSLTRTHWLTQQRADCEARPVPPQRHTVEESRSVSWYEMGRSGSVVRIALVLLG